MVRAAPWIALLVSACGADAAVLAPHIDVPAPGSEAYPYGGLDEIRLAVAHAGDADDLVAVSFGPGESLEVRGVPYATDLVVHMSGRTSGGEVAYGRTCAVDVSEEAPLPTPHLYFARTVKWAAGPEPFEPLRTGAAAYVTADGGALFAGGGVGVDALDYFDPRSGAFARLDATTGARLGSVLAPFSDGRALLIGGMQAVNAVTFYEVIDPLAASAPLQVEQIDDARLRLIDHAAVTLADGGILLVGGRAQAADGMPFVPTGATWSFAFEPTGVQPPEARPPLALPRARHTLTRLGDDLGAAVLVVGGEDAAGPIGTAELYEPLREAFADPAAFAPELITPRAGHAAVRMPDGSVLILGGVDALGLPVSTMELFRPLEGAFTPAGDLRDLLGAGLTGFSVTSLPDGRVLLAGGLDEDGAPVATSFIARLDPVDGGVDVVATDSLAVPRAAHAAVLLCDGTVLLVGGATSPEAPGSERYNPPSLSRRD